MAALTSAIMAAGAGAYAANQQKKAARTSAKAAMQAQGQAYGNNQANYQPYLHAGTNALGQLTQLNSGNMDSFHASPDYQWALNQGVNALDRSASAHGALYSGGHSADLMNYGAGLASQNLGNYYNRLASLAAMGQSSANALAGINQNYADKVSGIQSTAANQVAGANSQLVTGLAGLGNNALQSRASSYAAQPTTNALGQFWNNPANTANPGSLYNFGNNLQNLMQRRS